MVMTLECRTCGYTYDLTAEDIRSGTWQRRGCPICTAPRKDET